MAQVPIPPFERFSAERPAEVLRSPSRRIGSDRAEDAFRKTFLRASRPSRDSTAASTRARGS
jgi:hypothetical protein